MPRQASASRSSAAAAGSKAVRKHDSFIRKIIKNPKPFFAFAVLLADAILTSLIISYVPYTKIDWDAYMSQVTGFLGGERDYSKLEGDTGPLVYPAGFLYIYSAIQYVTGGQVFPAQVNAEFERVKFASERGKEISWIYHEDIIIVDVLFGLLYIVNLGMVLFIYLKTDVLPWWALCLVSLSKRVHSIFVLRLFNDCFATTLFHAALISFLYQKWHLGLVIFSGAVSVKMNVLLFAPPLLLLLLKILLGLPFILSHPVAYISRAFNLGRVFIHFWSVNFKFVPEQIFVSRGFALSLLAAHLILLAIFAHYRWCRHEGGLFSLLRSKLIQMKLNISDLSSFPLRRFNSHKSNSRVLRTEHITTTLFVGNFIGIVCARSLHYQFYSCLILFVTVEFCWNVFPSNVYSSTLLLGAHLLILGGLWMAPPEYPYTDDTNQKPANTKKKAS
ncbi:hypothetical protein DH2020_046124 [Rehmannia glutinosa]|uniref:dolichyl-P-Man:Man5GlcNAc2-PP-dolichol alpha-1,3-mannosyltransferase n=1 Tax=Rehmannia glutinosa TaxID=99300 RepID=A0ABR0UCF6_REHGL